MRRTRRVDLQRGPIEAALPGAAAERLARLQREAETLASFDPDRRRRST